MKMTRTELVAYVSDAATRADLPQDEQDKLVAAVSDPAVIVVARGVFRHWSLAWQRYIDCPATLAGLRYAGDGTPSRIGLFATWFDRATYSEAAQAADSDRRLIHIED